MNIYIIKNLTNILIYINKIYLCNICIKIFFLLTFLQISQIYQTTQLDQIILQYLQNQQFQGIDLQAVSPEQLALLKKEKIENEIENDNIQIHNQLINKQKVFVTTPESGYINQFDVFSQNKLQDINNQFQICLNSSQPPYLPVLTPIQYYTGLIDCQNTLLKYSYSSVAYLLTLAYKYDFNFAKIADEFKIFSAIQCLEMFITYIIALERNEHSLTQQEIEIYQSFKPFYQQLLWCELDKDTQQNQLAYFDTELVSQSILKQTDICFGLLRLAQARINDVAEKLNAKISYPCIQNNQNLSLYEKEIMKQQKQAPTFLLPDNITQEQFNEAIANSIKNISYKNVITTVPTQFSINQLTELYDTNTNQRDIDVKLFSSKSTTFTVDKYIRTGDLIQNISKNSLIQIQNQEFKNNLEFDLKQDNTLRENSCYSSSFRFTVPYDICDYAISPKEAKNQIMKQISDIEGDRNYEKLRRIKQDLQDLEINLKQTLQLEKIFSRQ